MFAIVTIAGQQFKVEEGQKIFVHRLDAQVGDKVSFDQVLLTDHNGSVNVGNPTIPGASVGTSVLSHAKGNKEIVFKKKRRKGYRVKNGHRQQFTQVEIKSIVAGSPVTIELGKKALAAKPFVAPKPEAVKVAAPKVEAPVVVEAPKAAKVKGDDLTKVEGIGPKVKGHLNDAGIFTFSDLAAQSEDAIRAILAPHGSPYSAMNPGTWPKQAELAAEGKWDELKAWQEELDGGK